MHLSFIGMSNIGKTYWARKLAAERGYDAVFCDDRIQDFLGGAAQGNIHDVAQWMGQPHEGRYADNSRHYLELETQVMRDCLDRLDQGADAPTIIDTTGSVIYLGKDILARLKALTRIVYFEASSNHTAWLFERYISAPKPVVWGDAYAPQAGETLQEALARCYPDLLRNRAENYSVLADVIIPFERHRDPQAALAMFD